MKKNSILIRNICCTILLLTSFGCRTYRGYREYIEKTDLSTENEKIIGTSYNLNFRDNKLIVSEIKKIYWTQNIRIDNVEEKIYTDQNGTLGHIIFSPFLLAISPLAILTMSEEKVEFENNTYVYSGGRQAWNYFNIFMNLGGKPEGKEKTILKSMFVKEPRTKEESCIVKGKINITLFIDNEEHSVTNDISLFSLTEKVFKNPTPNQKKEVYAKIKKSNFRIKLDSNVLFEYEDEITKNHDMAERLLTISQYSNATKYDILLIVKYLKSMSVDNLEACKALLEIYSSNPLSIFNENYKKEIEYYKEVVQQKEKQRIAEEKRLAEEREKEEKRLAEEREKKAYPLKNKVHMPIKLYQNIHSGILRKYINYSNECFDGDRRIEILWGNTPLRVTFDEFYINEVKESTYWRPSPYFIFDEELKIVELESGKLCRNAGELLDENLRIVDSEREREIYKEYKKSNEFLLGVKFDFEITEFLTEQQIIDKLLLS